MFTLDKETNNITIIKKDTAVFRIGLNNYVLSPGDRVTFTVAEGLELETPLIQKIVTEFQDNAAYVELSSTDTNLDEGTYKYDVQVNLADGTVDTIIGPANFKIVGGVTY
jgi:protein involved in polysaccharide export with SLBB domain